MKKEMVDINNKELYFYFSFGCTNKDNAMGRDHFIKSKPSVIELSGSTSKVFKMVVKNAALLLAKHFDNNVSYEELVSNSNAIIEDFVNNYNKDKIIQ